MTSIALRAMWTATMSGGCRAPAIASASRAIRGTLVRERPTVFVEVLSQARKLQRFLADLSREGVYRVFACGDAIAEVDPDVIETGRLKARVGGHSGTWGSAS